jgi:hypothetical protein
LSQIIDRCLLPYCSRAEDREFTAANSDHNLWILIDQSKDILPTTFGDIGPEPGCDNRWRPGGIADTTLALLGRLALLERL